MSNTLDQRKNNLNICEAKVIMGNKFKRKKNKLNKVKALYLFPRNLEWSTHPLSLFKFKFYFLWK